MKSSSEHSDLQNRFSKLVNENSARWIGIARSYTRPEDHDDLFQDILLQVWKSLPGFRGQSKIETWSYRIALNTALGWSRRKKTREKHQKKHPFEITQTPQATATYHEEISILEEFLASLSKSERAVMLLHLENIPNCQAAEILGISEGTLRVRIHRIKQKFESRYINSTPSWKENSK